VRHILREMDRNWKNIMELNMSSSSETYLGKQRKFNFTVHFRKIDICSIKLIKTAHIVSVITPQKTLCKGKLFNALNGKNRWLLAHLLMSEKRLMCTVLAHSANCVKDV
jgi:hypothetical protein